MRMNGLKPNYVGNLTLTTELQAVTVSEDTRITKILMDTQDGEDFNFALTSDATETFTFSYDRASSPFQLDFDRQYLDSDSTTLFYVSGVAGSVLQYMTFVR